MSDRVPAVQHLPRRPRPAGRRSATALAAATLLAALALAAAGPASAHDELVSSVPAQGDVLAVVPDVVVLTFSEDVEDLGTTVVATDSAGAALADGAPAVEGVSVRQALLPATAGGEVVVRYRVVSADGHPVSGEIRFTVAAPEPSASQPPTSASPTASTAPPTASPSTTPVADEQSGGSALPWVIALVASAAAVLAAIGVARRRGAGTGS